MSSIHYHSLAALTLLSLVNCRTSAPAIRPAHLSSRESASAESSESWRYRRPEPLAARDWVPPNILRLTLKDGVAVYVAENHAIPIVTVRLLVTTTTARTKPGAEWLLAHLLSEGSSEASGSELAAQLARLGAALSVQVRPDFIELSFDVLTRNLDATLQLFADMTLRRRLQKDDFERVKRQALTELRRQNDSGAVLAENVLRAVLYGRAHPYHYSSLGTEESMKALSYSDLLTAYREYWQPKNASFVVVGDIHPLEAQKMLDAQFGTWVNSSTTKESRPLGVAENGSPSRVVLVDRSNARQVTLAVGHLGLARQASDWFAVDVMNRCLGSNQMLSRLMRNLRQDKGYTYGVRSTFTENVGRGYFAIQADVALDKTALTVREIRREIQRMITEPPVGKELDLARKAAALSVLNRIETNASIADVINRIAVFGLPLDYLAELRRNTLSVTAEAVSAAAKEYLHPDKLQLVVVGPADELEKHFRALEIGPIERRTMTGEPLQSH